MENAEAEVVSHYADHDGVSLFDRIYAALAAQGVAAADVTAEHLKGVDEFHIGGVDATLALLDQLAIAPATRVLDIGSGIGGPARLIASRYGAQVTGVDLTPDFVETARRLSAAVGSPTEFIVGSAFDLPFADATFDLATLLHVGMNLPDKPRLFAEAARVLRPGGTFAVYDVMLFGNHPDFPVPWSSGPESSFLSGPYTYLDAAAEAGFTLRARRDRGDVVRAFFVAMQERMAKAGPPAIGLPLIMGPTAPVKAANMIKAVTAGDIAPVEMIFDRR
ncbi:methyltransferase domain-containing protein [bacterium]|nr:methyltransferase domain-containing protein [bacterium]